MGTLEQLKNIADKMDEIGASIRRESTIFAAELSERQRLGLSGEAAIKHYNEWMDKNNMPHLKVE